MVKRVLVVDDDDDILEALAVILEDSFEVVAVKNGLEALTALERHSFDAMVLDLTMPEMDGETVIEHMKQRGIVLPVMLASGISELSRLANKLEVDYLGKPYDLSALIAKLHKMTGAASER